MKERPLPKPGEPGYTLYHKQACGCVIELSAHDDTAEINPCWLHDSAPAMLEALRALEHLASVLNSRQHAGMEITPVMWSELYQRCNESKAAIARAEGKEPRR